MNDLLTEILRLGGSAVILGIGILMLLSPRRWQHDRSEMRERALAQRLARGHDRYFEELRTLQAYSQPRSHRTIRFFGAMLILIASAALVLSLIQFVSE